VRSNLPNRLLPLVKDPSPRYVLAIGGRWKIFVMLTRENYFNEAGGICGSLTNKVVEGLRADPNFEVVRQELKQTRECFEPGDGESLWVRETYR